MGPKRIVHRFCVLGPFLPAVGKSVAGSAQMGDCRCVLVCRGEDHGLSMGGHERGQDRSYISRTPGFAWFSIGVGAQFRSYH